MLPESIKAKLEDRGYIFNESDRLEGFFSFPVSPLVTINFEDSSVCVFRYAFTETVDNYLVVFAEHCGYHVFGLSMVESVKYSTM